MSGIIGDIQERSSAGVSAPVPPSFADQATTGFPQIKHRSRVSAFKRARTQAVTASSSSQHAPPVISSMPVESRLAPQPSPSPTTTASTVMDTQQILQQVQSENEARVADMSSIERETAIQELQEMFGSDLLERLKLRAEKKKAVVITEGIPASNPAIPKDDSTVTAREAENGEQVPAVAFDIPSQDKGKSKVRFATPSDLSDSCNDPLSSRAIHDRYFPDQPMHLPGLEWMQDSTPGSVSSRLADIRFDLSGNPLSEKDVSDLPATLGLHHHGNDPSSAGYTAEEVLHLATSTFGPQRTIMLSLASKITSQLGSYPPGTRQALIKGDLVAKVAKLGVNILCSSERNLGIVREGISCLHAAVDAASETAKQSQNLPLDSLLPRIEKLLEEPMKSSSLAPPSIQNLVAFLQSVADDSIAQAEEVTAILPTLVESLVVGCSWPSREGSSAPAELTIATLTLRLLYTCTASHRDITQSLLRKGVYAELLRFIAAPPWSWTCHRDILGLAMQCTALTMNIIEAVNRFGLYGSVVMTIAEAIQGVGLWIGNQAIEKELPTDAAVVQLSTAYFNLLRTWIICASDSHSMEHEHDLTWSQVNGMPWADEAIETIELSVSLISGWIQGEKGRNTSAIPYLYLVGSCCELLEARVKGITSNGIIGWREEKNRLTTLLRASGIVELPTLLLLLLGARSPHPLNVYELNAATLLAASLCGVLHELDLLRPALSTADFDVGSYLKSMKVDPSSSRAIGRLSFLLLQVVSMEKAQAWASCAIDTLSLLGPGDESYAMQIIDQLIDLAWPEEDIQATGHRHGFYILRPFLHYVVLPNLDNVVGPIPPIPKYLKLTKTLRQPVMTPRPTVTRMDLQQKRRLGMPLTGDFLLAPIEELLKGPSSPAFKQLPPAWDATDLDLARTCLVFLRLIQENTTDGANISLHASEVMLALMKVFLLENRPADVDDEGQPVETHEVIFRDDVVEREMRRLLDPYLVARSPGVSSRARSVEPPTTASTSSFYQLYESFVDLYQSISFSHDIFGRLLLPPLAMHYPADHRRLFWVDHQRSVLRSIAANNFDFEDVPLEMGTGTLECYFLPAESDSDVLRGYVGALVHGLVSPERGEFLFSLAVWHVAQSMWVAQIDQQSGADAEMDHSQRDTIMGLFGRSSKLSPRTAERILKCVTKLTPGRVWADLAMISIEPEEVQRRLESIEVVVGRDAMEVWTTAGIGR